MTDHQSGKLKQTNKKHKGRTSKRFQKESFGAGKVASRKGAATSNYARDLVRDSRNNRMNKAKQLQKSKRSEIWLQQRIGANDGPPKVVGIVPLSADTNVFSVLQECLREASWSDRKSDATGSHHLVNALYLKYKARCSYVVAEATLASALDVARVADILVLVVDGGSAQEFVIDQNGATTLSALKAIGLGTPLCCVQNLPPKKHKTYTQTKRMVQRVAESFIDPGVKIIEDNGSALAAVESGSAPIEVEETGNDTFIPGKTTFSATQPASEMTRAIVACTVKEVSWRSIRSTVVGDSLELLDCLPEAPESNRVRVTGYLRGTPLYMHSLIHMLGVNTCTLESVEVGSDPLTAASRRLKGQGQRGAAPLGDGSEGSTVYRADPSKQDSLVMESTPDSLMGEQTWPTEEELLQQTSMNDGMAGRDQRHVPTAIPVGMSSYQADWYVDEKGNFEPEYEEVEQEAAEGKMTLENDDAHDMKGSDDDDDDDDDNMTMDGSILNMANFPGASSTSQPKKSKLKLAQEDDEFPDEIDTPEDVAARVRFARFRNLQSFRTSPWHPKENLPSEYSRIYQFENFNLAQRSAVNHLKAIRHLQDSQKLESRATSVAASKASRSRASSFATTSDDCVDMDGMEEMGSVGGATGSIGTSATIRGAEEFIPTGQYVSIVLSNVSPAVVEAYQTQGFVALFSLLPHENKLSVLHFSVERCDGYDEPIKSKEELTFQVGFRTFTGRPIYSEINLNCDKHKMERFFKKGTLSMASVYGPVTFLPCPLLVFKKHEVTGRMVMVAKGALSAIDPDRIMLKKVILTGVPIRVRKRSAVVRQLFYDPQDVRWFKPAELVTKWGIRGHIKEPIGTHGLLKAQFGAPIKQNDTVMLILYKRMFPKFSDDSSKVVCS